MSSFEDDLKRLEAELPHIDVEELKQWMEKKLDFLLVDVREPHEFMQANIPGSINLPRSRIASRITSVMPSPDQTIVVNCGGRGRSHLVCETLREMGLDSVVLRGGVQAWLAA